MFDGLKKMTRRFTEETLKEDPLIVVGANDNTGPDENNLASVHANVTALKDAKEQDLVDPVDEAIASITEGGSAVNAAMEAQVRGPVALGTPPSMTTMPKEPGAYERPASALKRSEIASSIEPRNDKTEVDERSHLATMALMREEAAKKNGPASALSIGLGSLGEPKPTKKVEKEVPSNDVKSTKSGTSEIEATLSAIRGTSVERHANENIPEAQTPKAVEISTETGEDSVVKEDTTATLKLVKDVPGEPEQEVVDEVAAAPVEVVASPLVEEIPEEKTMTPVTEEVVDAPKEQEEATSSVIKMPVPEMVEKKALALLKPTEDAVDLILSEVLDKFDEGKGKEKLAERIKNDMELEEIFGGLKTEDGRPVIGILKAVADASAPKQLLAKAIKRAEETKLAA